MWILLRLHLDASEHLTLRAKPLLSMASIGGVEKTLEKIQKMIDSGSHYEAQQMLKTIYHRHKARKQISESYKILAEGAAMQLQHHQVTCGIELGLMLIEALTTDKSMDVDEALAIVMTVLTCLPCKTKQSDDAASVSQQHNAVLDEEARYVAAAVKWAKRRGRQEGVRSIHALFAQHIWSTYGWRHMGRANQYFVRSDDAVQFAGALVACARLAPVTEADLFPTRAILQVLATATKESSVEQLEYAADLLEQCMQAAPEIKQYPLLNFTSLLLKALRMRSATLVTFLKQKYAIALSRDDSFGVYLAQVERTYLGIGAESSGGIGGMLGGLLKSLMALDDDEKSDD
ncbi:hypothetical protein CEUSTIGMA_g1296.t1 [Chlamydomonas eustigma]|uniref:Uncharacterized protein n=1 Tax=Chlamydomonas eustigma TaxID=1157962 RepID=A0A250WSX5_9CHLO|nr:hypothetical protein CEUSTIGMA_g1296.t1 [Chlamydomonas eustigma]|eukprot:GAX73846.1 hypothetical protein CEUSTIGMA_g1296.t1 [Chlamydomonas eustigma]